MAESNDFNQSQRHFMSGLVVGTLGLIARDYLHPLSAFASSSLSTTNTSTREIYHIFVPYAKARRGGQQKITLRSGETALIRITRGIKEDQETIISEVGLAGEDIAVVFHTLYDVNTSIKDKIYQEINKIKFLQESSREKCKLVYERLEDAEYVDDMEAMELLDYVISSSKLDSQIKQRYKIASKNSRLVGIEKTIQSALADSNLKENEKKVIRGTYECVRAGEPVPNFRALTDLDTIVTNSTLPLTVQQTYSLGSATSRALTVDIILVDFIDGNRKLSSATKEKYQKVYDQVRDGQPVSDPETLSRLDVFIKDADIPENAKVVYLLARKQQETSEEGFAEQVNAFVQNANAIKDQLYDAKDVYINGGAVVPKATQTLATMGVEARTGVTLSSLSGAAATNATLAVLGGGSVATGGLGMLGGLAVATGGAALIGAAGLTSVVLVSQMDSEDLKNLGVAITTGTLAGAATVFGAWTAASALGVAGTLSGAAAITTTMSALGGLSVMTGGAALVASGTAFVI